MTIHLDAMNREPEAGTCDAEVDASREFVEEFSKAFNPDVTTQVATDAAARR